MDLLRFYDYPRVTQCRKTGKKDRNVKVVKIIRIGHLEKRVKKTEM